MENANEMTKKDTSLQLLVFKDNFAARGFKLTQNWLLKYGIIQTVIFLGFALAISLAIRSYQELQKMNPEYVQRLETDMEKLYQSNDRLTEELERLKASSAPQVSQTKEKSDQVSDQTLVGSSIIYAISPSVQPLDPSSRPSIVTEGFSAEWSKNSLKVNLNIRYVKEDGRNQQGRLIVLARAPGYFQVHPRNAINLSASQPIIAVENGEFFSVSRFRKVVAKFDLLSNQRLPERVQIVIFDRSNKVIVDREFELPKYDPSNRNQSTGNSTESAPEGGN